MIHVLAVGLSGLILVGLMLPAPAAAQRRDGGSGRGLARDLRSPQHPQQLVGPRLSPRPVDPRLTASRQFPPADPFPAHRGGDFGRPGGRGHGGFDKHGRGRSHGFVASGPVVTYWPGYVVESGPVYAVPPSDYVPAPRYDYPPPPSAPAPPPPPMPAVIEHATGRYELRGDGIAVPYQWVWIPNPPAEPPPSSREPSGPVHTAPPRRSELFTWTDGEGVVHWTDNLGAVPQQYRSRVQKRSL